VNLVKGRAWKCRGCGYMRTKHGEVVSLAAMRDLIHNHKVEKGEEENGDFYKEAL